MCKISINSVLLSARKSLTKSGSLFLVHPTRVSSDINNFYYPDNGYIRVLGI